jgi:hypothetical protein
VRKRWMLRSVRGESAAEAPPAPSPTHPPEAVLQAQLLALREHRYTDVFVHASPANQAATGPIQKFARLLQSPAYLPLLDHEGAETLQRLQPTASVFMELVRVYPGGAPKARLAEQLRQQQAAARPPRGGKPEPAPRPSVTYLWVLSRQPEGGQLAGCWMVDSVQPVDPLSPPPPMVPPPGVA